MITSPKLLPLLILVTVILMGVMSILLFKQDKEDAGEPVEGAPQEVRENTQPPESPARVTPSVSQEESLEVAPLGTDLNMEFPTLEE